MAPRSTQSLVKMSTRNISWGYRQPVREIDNITTFICRKSGSLNLLEHFGPHWACYGTALPLPLCAFVRWYSRYRWQRGLRSCSHLIAWDRGFESRCGHGFSFLVWAATLIIHSEECNVFECMSDCVWCRNLNNEVAWAPVGLWRQRKESPLIIYSLVTEAPILLHGSSRNKPWGQETKTPFTLYFSLDHVILPYN